MRSKPRRFVVRNFPLTRWTTISHPPCQSQRRIFGWSGDKIRVMFCLVLVLTFSFIWSFALSYFSGIGLVFGLFWVGLEDD